MAADVRRLGYWARVIVPTLESSVRAERKHESCVIAALDGRCYLFRTDDQDARATVVRATS